MANDPKDARAPRLQLSVVVPVFNEVDVISALHAELWAELNKLTETVACELLLIDDGSTDGTRELLAALSAAEPRTRVIRLSRNFGQQCALTAGLDHAGGDAVVVMDADLQDPPALIPIFVQRWLAGADVVYGRRVGRQGESRSKRLTAALFYRILHRLTSIDIPADAGDFRLLSRRAVDQFIQLREKGRFVRGLVSWIGFKQEAVDYERHPRAGGRSKYPYATMWKFAIDGLTSFSTAPLRLATVLGYLTSGLAFLYLVYIFTQAVLGATVRGWPSIMAAMLFLGGVQLICLGIVGEYIGRIFDEVKGRPIYIVESAISSTDNATPQPPPANEAPHAKT